MMKGILNKLRAGEKGQAMILALILLAVGGLIIAPMLSFMGTGLIAGQVYEKNMKGFYAADAGIEDALWKIKYDPPAPGSYPLPADVNGMSVDVTIVEVTVLYGEYDVGGGGPNYDWFDLESEFLGYDGDENWGIYSYKLSLTNKKTAPVKLDSVTVSYSATLSYLSGLTNGDIGGLALPPKSDFEDGTPTLPETLIGSFKILAWEFPSPRPEMGAAGDLADPESWVTVTCFFQLEGPPGAPEIWAFVKTRDADIGTIWEYKLFKIMAWADDGGAVITTVLAGVLESSDTVILGSWQIE